MAPGVNAELGRGGDGERGGGRAASPRGAVARSGVGDGVVGMGSKMDDRMGLMVVAAAREQLMKKVSREGKLVGGGGVGEGWDRREGIADLGAVFVGVSLVPPPLLSLPSSLSLRVQIAWGVVFVGSKFALRFMQKSAVLMKCVCARVCVFTCVVCVFL